jgi:hypothetical protein
MKKRIAVFLITTLLFAYIVPVSGIIAEPNKTTILIVSFDPNDFRQAPPPGDLPDNYVFPEIPENEIKILEPPKVTFSGEDEPIIEMIESVTYDMILGYLENITSFGPRVTGTPASLQASQYLYNVFDSMGLDVRFQPWSYYGYNDRNVEAELQGNDPSSNQIYVVCAHFDSVSGSPGADDDGSGVAAFLACAYLMSQYEFNHTIRFVGFSGEEQGLLGSHEYAKEAKNNGDNIVGALNADMIGFAITQSDGEKIKIYYNTASQWLLTFTQNVNQAYSEYLNLNIISQPGSANSDHYSFWQYGYDAIFYHEYKFNDYYHSPQDTIANMNVTYNVKTTKFILATLAELAECFSSNTPPEIPTISGDTQGYNGEELTFYAISTDIEEDMIYYKFDWGNGGYSDWIGPYDSGETMSTTNIWPEPGQYQVRVKAMDTNNSMSDWSEPHALTIIQNSPPDKPKINSPLVGRTGKPIILTLSAIDPDNHDVNFYIRWGDGISEYWLGPYNSGEEATFSHTYTAGGAMTIVVKAMDEFGKEGQQDQLTILILKNKAAATNPILSQILYFIKNNFPRLGQILGL